MQRPSLPPEVLRPSPGWAGLLAEVDHQVRTPMNGILGMTQLLLSTNLSRHQRQMAQVVIESSQNLLSLIQDILDLARMEAGSPVLADKPVDLASFLEDSAWRSGLGASPPLPAVEVRIEPDLPRRILGDARRLEGVVLAMLRQTARGMEGGRVGLRARLLGSGSTAEMMIETAGRPEGVPLVSDLFLPFYRMDSLWSVPGVGLGPGLFLAREWVKRMGGRFGTETRTGEGTWTWLTLPIREPVRMQGGEPPMTGRGEREEAPGAAPRPSPSGPPPSQTRILVVEDNRINQRVFESMLEHLGYGCRMVANGQEALEAMAVERFDLVFMDCQMPVMDGYEAVRRVRASRPAQACTIIAMTAHALDGDREKCLQAGMDDYLAKPVSLESLGQMLGRWLKPSQPG